MSLAGQWDAVNGELLFPIFVVFVLDIFSVDMFTGETNI